METHLVDGTCYQCRTGRAHVCRNLRILGVDADGAFAEYIVLPVGNIWPSEGLAPEIAAILGEDQETASRLLDADPSLAERIRSAHPGLVLEAADAGRVRAVTVLAELGFDVSARARPGSGHANGATPLHVAAIDGHEATVAELLRLGADPTVHDAEHGSTPLGWAEYAGQAGTADLLREPPSRS